MEALRTSVSARRKRLDAVDKRRINADAVILAQRGLKHESDDGGPYRKAGESIDACLARYGIDPRRQCCILFNLTGFP